MNVRRWPRHPPCPARTTAWSSWDGSSDASTSPLDTRYRLAGLAAGIDAGGRRAWQTFHRHPMLDTTGADDHNDVVLSPDGRTAYVGGTWGKSGDQPDSDLLVVAYDTATGDERWSRAIDGPARQRDVGTVVALSADGAALGVAGTVCVRLTDRCENWDWLVARLDARSGEIVWSARHESGEANDEPRGIVVTPDAGTLVVTGTTGTGCAGIAATAQGFTCDTDTATVGYEFATGSQRWILREDPADTDDQPTAVAIDPRTSQVVMTSNSRSRAGGAGPPTTVASTTSLGPAEGNILWRAAAPGTFAHDLEFLAGGGRVVVVGERDDDVASHVYRAADGRPLASLLHDGPVQGEDTAYAVAAAPSGGFAVGGSVRAGPALTDFDGTVVAYDGALRKAWSAVMPAIRSVAGVHVRADGSGAVAVGTSDDSDGPDAVAVGLAAGDVFRPCRPRGRAARRSALGPRRLRLRGEASAGCAAPVEAVEVAVARRDGRRCRHLVRSGRLGPRRGCTARRWMTAVGTRRWKLAMAARLRSGSYVVSVRARAAGVTGAVSSRRLRVG